MNLESKQHVAVEDMPFSPITEREAAIIGRHKKKLLMKAFQIRLFYSIAATAIICGMEIIARLIQNMSNTIPGTVAFVLFLFVIFNLLSYGYVIMTRKIDAYAEHSEYFYGNIAEKFEKHKLSKENGKRSENYVILETDTHRCTTAFPVEFPSDFEAMQKGERMLLVKSSPFGDKKYRLYFDKAPEVNLTKNKSR